MEFTVHSFVPVVHQLESVASIAVHVPETVRSSAVAEQKRHLAKREESRWNKFDKNYYMQRGREASCDYLVGGLRSQGDEIPEHVGILQMGSRVPLLGVDEVRELQEKRSQRSLPENALVKKEQHTV